MDDIALGIGLSGYAPTDWSMFKQGLDTQRRASAALQAQKAKEAEGLKDIMKSLKIDYSKYKPYQFGDIKHEFASTMKSVVDEFKRTGSVSPEVHSKIDDFEMWLGTKAQRAHAIDMYEKQNQSDYFVDQEFLSKVYDSKENSSTISQWGEGRGISFTQDGDLVAPTGVGRFDRLLSSIPKEVTEDLMNTPYGSRTVLSDDNQSVKEASLGMSKADIDAAVKVKLSAINNDRNIALGAFHHYGVPFTPDAGKGPVGGFLDLMPPAQKAQLEKDIRAQYETPRRNVRGTFKEEATKAWDWGSMANESFQLKKTTVSDPGMVSLSDPGAQNAYVFQSSGKTPPQKRLTLPAGSEQLAIGNEGDIIRGDKLKGSRSVQGVPAAMYIEGDGARKYKIATKAMSKDAIDALISLSIDPDSPNADLVRSGIESTYIVPSTPEVDAYIQLMLGIDDAGFEKLWTDLKGASGAPASIAGRGAGVTPSGGNVR